MAADSKDKDPGNVRQKTLKNIANQKKPTFKLPKKPAMFKKSAKPKLPDISREELYDLHVRQGITVQGLTKRLGISYWAVEALLKNKNIDIQRLDATDLEEGDRFNRDEMKRLHFDEELTTTEIGNIYDSSPSLINRCLKKYKLSKDTTEPVHPTTDEISERISNLSQTTVDQLPDFKLFKSELIKLTKKIGFGKRNRIIFDTILTKKTGASAPTFADVRKKLELPKNINLINFITQSGNDIFRSVWNTDQSPYLYAQVLQFRSKADEVSKGIWTEESFAEFAAEYFEEKNSINEVLTMILLLMAGYRIRHIGYTRNLWTDENLTTEQAEGVLKLARNQDNPQFMSLDALKTEVDNQLAGTKFDTVRLGRIASAAHSLQVESGHIIRSGNTVTIPLRLKQHLIRMLLNSSYGLSTDEIFAKTVNFKPTVPKEFLKSFLEANSRYWEYNDGQKLWQIKDSAEAAEFIGYIDQPETIEKIDGNRNKQKSTSAITFAKTYAFITTEELNKINDKIYQSESLSNAGLTPTDFTMLKFSIKEIYALPGFSKEAREIFDYIFLDGEKKLITKHKLNAHVIKSGSATKILETARKRLSDIVWQGKTHFALTKFLLHLRKAAQTASGGIWTIRTYAEFLTSYFHLSEQVNVNTSRELLFLFGFDQPFQKYDENTVWESSKMTFEESKEILQVCSDFIKSREIANLSELVIKLKEDFEINIIVRQLGWLLKTDSHIRISRGGRFAQYVTEEKD